MNSFENLWDQIRQIFILNIYFFIFLKNSYLKNTPFLRQSSSSLAIQSSILKFFINTFTTSKHT